MLISMLNSQYARFEALAEAWLAQGATAFGIFTNGLPMIYWPSSQQLARPSLAEPIIIAGREFGELRVAGISGAAAQRRLKVDADMVGRLLQLEDELHSMTSDLVHNQDQQLALYRLAGIARDHAPVEETIKLLVDESVRAVGVEAAFVCVVPASGQDPVLIQNPPHFLPDKSAWDVYWESQIAERDVHIFEQSEVAGEPPPTYRNLLMMPIYVRGSIAAGLGLVNRKGGFRSNDIKLARAIADYTSSHVELGLLYQKIFDQGRLHSEMDLARRVQINLLPRQIPTVPGVDIYADSRLASQVGGDFYDFIAIDGRPLIFSVGDVTGKGIAAALLMTMTRTAIHSKAQFVPGATPETVMRQSNEDLYNDFTRIGVFATVFVGQYHPERRELVYANAGHSPVIYRPHNGAPTLLRADSTAIGILSVSHCRNQVLRIGPGDLLVVATDGLSDARRNDDVMFEIDRLMELVDKLADRSARSITEELFRAVDRFSGGSAQDDDQTLVVIKGVDA